MNWKESDNRGQNPWGDNNSDPFEQLKKILSNIFGKNDSNGGDENQSGTNLPIKKIILGVLSVILLIWLSSGLYQIENAERGVVTRFGQFLKVTEEGLNWNIPYPIENVEIVNIGIVRSIEIGFRANRGKILSESLMLTQDENIIDVQLAVQYQISNPQKYLFNDSNPEITLRQTIESVLREVVGRSKMDFVLTEGRAEVSDKVKNLAQESLNQFDIGLILTNVNMQNAQAPEQVQAAFDDAVKAREDKERFINEAQAYSNEILPRARGEAARIIEESEAYKEKVIAEAEGQTQRFEDIYEEYKKAPKVTRERLYIDAMEKVLQDTNKIIIDVEGGNNLLYLPLDKLISNSNNSGNLTNSNNNLINKPQTNTIRQRINGGRTR